MLMKIKSCEPNRHNISFKDNWLDGRTDAGDGRMQTPGPRTMISGSSIPAELKKQKKYKHKNKQKNKNKTKHLLIGYKNVSTQN